MTERVAEFFRVSQAEEGRTSGIPVVADGSVAPRECHGNDSGGLHGSNRIEFGTAPSDQKRFSVFSQHQSVSFAGKLPEI